MWQHLWLTNPMMKFPYPISKELFRVLMIRAVYVEYLGESVGPPLVGHQLTGMLSESPVPPFEVEWTWMMKPLMGTLGAPVLAFGPPLAVASAPVAIPARVVHTVEVN